MSRDRVEARFGAMGREARVVVMGGPARADERARHVIEVAERKWSRYRQGSEVSKVTDKNNNTTLTPSATFKIIG